MIAGAHKSKKTARKMHRDSREEEEDWGHSQDDDSKLPVDEHNYSGNGLPIRAKAYHYSYPSSPTVMVRGTGTGATRGAGGTGGERLMDDGGEGGYEEEERIQLIPAFKGRFAAGTGVGVKAPPAKLIAPG